MNCIFNQLRSNLIDPQAVNLAEKVKWLHLDGLPTNESFPVAILGSGPMLLLLHGFDSSFFEFRRIAPLLENHYQLVIPDLFGFGFTPRPSGIHYGPDLVLKHLTALLNRLNPPSRIGLIGASMGGSVAMELARLHSSKISSLLLLAPAGLDGRQMSLPPFLDLLDMCIF